MLHITSIGSARLPQHLECWVRAGVGSVGHLRGRCSCYGGTEEDPDGLTLREAARAAVLVLLGVQLTDIGGDGRTYDVHLSVVTMGAAQYTASAIFDGERWSALCWELDIASDGDSAAEALANLGNAVCEALAVAADEGVLPGQPVSPSDLRDFLAAHRGRRPSSDEHDQSTSA